MWTGAFIGLVTVGALVAAPTLGAAQDVTAEIRTWSGQSWQLAQPSLEVFFTIRPKPPEAGAVPPLPALLMAPGASAPPAPPAAGAALGPAPGRPEGVEPQQGHQELKAVTLYREGVATRVPLENVATLQFFRQPVVNSPLPPYAAVTHFRYSAMAVLTDGSRVEGDYINLGTALLRGLGAGGPVDIPWVEIEVVLFRR